jgi:hypothetical protein
LRGGATCAYLWQAPGREKALRSASFAVVRFNDSAPYRKHHIPFRFPRFALQDIENPRFACCDPHQALVALCIRSSVALRIIPSLTP